MLAFLRGPPSLRSARSRRLHHPGRNLVELLPGSFSRCSNFPLDVDTMAENPPRPYVSSTRKIMPFHDVAVWLSPHLTDSPPDPPPDPSTSFCYSSYLHSSQATRSTTEDDESVFKLLLRGAMMVSGDPHLYYHVARNDTAGKGRCTALSAQVFKICAAAYGGHKK